MFLFLKISGSKSLEALSEIDELPPPVPKKGSKPDSGISPESIRRRTTIGGRLLHRSSSPASMLRTVTSPVQPPRDKYYSLDLFSRYFYVESLDVQFPTERTSKRDITLLASFEKVVCIVTQRKLVAWRWKWCLWSKPKRWLCTCISGTRSFKIYSDAVFIKEALNSECHESVAKQRSKKSALSVLHIEIIIILTTLLPEHFATRLFRDFEVCIFHDT